MGRSKFSSNNQTQTIITIIIVAIIVAATIFFIFRNPGETMSNTIIITTNKGVIEVELNKEASPITVDNFLTYVDEEFFDGTIFHRIMDGFMIQGGGFTPDGKQKTAHAPITLESQNGLKNDRGTIAMARTSDPNSATAQFFINTVDNDFLNYAPGNDGYAAFGIVTKGMDIVDEIVKVKTQTSPMPDWPTEPIIIESIGLK